MLLAIQGLSKKRVDVVRFSIVGIVTLRRRSEVGFEAESLDVGGSAGVGVNRDNDAVDANVVFGNAVRVGHLGHETLDDTIGTAAEDGGVRAGHAQVGNVSGAVGQNSFVGGGDVGVSAEDEADLAVEEPAEGDLFTGGLSVDVHDDGFNTLGQALEDAGGGNKRIIADQRHIHPAQQRKNGDLRAPLGGINGPFLAGSLGGKIGRADDGIGILQGFDNLALAINVIAEGDKIDAILEQFVVGLGG